MTAPGWPEVALLMVLGPEGPGGPVRLRGRLRVEHVDGLWDVEPFSLRELTPADLGGWEPYTAAELDVEVDGDRLRVAVVGAGPWLIADADDAWLFAREGVAVEVPSRRPRDEVFLEAPVRCFLDRVPADVFEPPDPWAVTDDVSATHHLGRPAWVLTLTEAEGLAPSRFTVDRATGWLLALEAGPLRAGWVELEFDPAPAGDRFGWDGPELTRADETALAEAEEEALQQRGFGWWERRVGPTGVVIEADVPLDLSVTAVTDHDPVTGAFTAHLAQDTEHPLTLHRRPRRAGVANDAAGWDAPAEGHGHRWSTPRHDWFLTGLLVELTPAGRSAVEASFPG